MEQDKEREHLRHINHLLASAGYQTGMTDEIVSRHRRVEQGGDEVFYDPRRREPALDGAAFAEILSESHTTAAPPPAAKEADPVARAQTHGHRLNTIAADLRRERQGDPSRPGRRRRRRLSTSLLELSDARRFASYDPAAAAAAEVAAAEDELMLARRGGKSAGGGGGGSPGQRLRARLREAAEEATLRARSQREAFVAHHLQFSRSRAYVSHVVDETYRVGTVDEERLGDAQRSKAAAAAAAAASAAEHGKKKKDDDASSSKSGGGGGQEGDEGYLRDAALRGSPYEGQTVPDRLRAQLREERAEQEEDLRAHRAEREQRRREKLAKEEKKKKKAKEKREQGRAASSGGGGSEGGGSKPTSRT